MRSTPYKVMFVVTSMIIGGAEKQLVHLLRHLSRKVFQPVVVCLKEPGVLAKELSVLDIPVYSRLLVHKYDLRVFLKLIAIIKREKVDILWARSTGDKMFWGRLAAKLVGVPVILTSIHFMGEKGQRKSIIGPLNKVLTPITDRIIAVSENQKRYLIEEEGLPGQKIVVIPNGIDWKFFKPSKDTEAIKRSLNIPEDGFVIGQVAKLRPEKGHRVLLQAAGKLKEQGKEGVVLLIGDGPERQALEAACEMYSLRSMVRFLGDRTDLADLINILDIGTLSSPMETFPNALLEYMALAKPVVAPRVGGIPEIVADGIDGLLFSPGDADQMASQLLFLLTHPTKAKEMGLQGEKKVRDSFSMEANIEKIEGLFLSLLAGKGYS
jgi:glycosyltransferase involved in cell wall biosynthesis